MWQRLHCDTENDKAGLQLCVFAALYEYMYVGTTSIYIQVQLETF